MLSETKQEIYVKDIVKVTQGKLIIGKEETLCENFSRDTREIKEGDIYFGIKGEKINGSIFWKEALDKGAKGVILQDIVISKEEMENYPNAFIILVKDVVLAMGQIASYKRNLYNIPVIAITGSVGKTSTKDIVANVIAQKYKTLKTQGNYNNQIGLPLTILQLKQEEALVVEMGMNHFGEIRYLTKIAKPNVVAITNIGTAHIGILGSRQNILKAKLEILEGMQEGGTVVINKDNDLLQEWYEKNKDKYTIVTYGIKQPSDYMATQIISKEDKSTYLLKTKNIVNEEIMVPVGGDHFVQNSLCAIAIGEVFSINIESMKEGIARFELTKKRMDISKIENNITIINDCYNANLDSMKAAITYLGKIEGKRRIAVLGDMLELGEFSEKLHREVGREVVKQRLDKVVLVGKEARYIGKQAIQEGITKEDIVFCRTNEEAINIINSMKQENDVILLKASNGMHFDEIVHKISITCA